MLNYITHLTSFKEFGSECFVLCFLYRRSNFFETCQMLLLLFCLNKDQFWFLLMLMEHPHAHGTPY